MEIDTNIVLYNDLRNNFIVKLPKQETWKKYSRVWGDSMHRICSYVAMFSPSLADYFIKKYSKDNDIVLDTFSGRGTTLLQARLLGRQTYAIDLNPFAYVLSQAKSQSFKINEILERVKYWEEKYNNSKIDSLENIQQELKIYYSEKNLHQLLFIKENLGKNYSILSQVDNFILAIWSGSKNWTIIA